MQYSKINIRTVNAFLRKKGIDPKELTGNKSKKLTLNRKQKRRIEELLESGARVLIHTKKTGRIVIRDASQKFNFEKPEILKKARRVVLDMANGNVKAHA